MNKKKCMILALAVLPMLNSCSDWLDPKPLSFYSPENTYVDAAGLYAALTACERNMRHALADVGVQAGTAPAWCPCPGVECSDFDGNVFDRYRSPWKNR